MKGMSVVVVHVFGGDVESVLGVFDDAVAMLKAMEADLATWVLHEDETVGGPRYEEDGCGGTRAIYPVMIRGKECHRGSCYTVEKYELNQRRGR